MLKNSVPVAEYLLMSEPLFRASDDWIRPRARVLELELEGLGKAPAHFLGWIAGWAVVLSVAVITLAGITMSAGRPAAAISEVRRPAHSVVVLNPSTPFHAENDIDYAL